MEDKIVLKGTGKIYVGGYLNTLELDGQNVAKALTEYLGLTEPGDAREILGELTLTIRPLSQSLTIHTETMETGKGKGIDGGTNLSGN